MAPTFGTTALIKHGCEQEQLGKIIVKEQSLAKIIFNLTRKKPLAFMIL